MSAEERAIRQRYPYLSDYGVKQAIEPTRYYVEGHDPEMVRAIDARHPDEEYDPDWYTQALVTRDAKTLPAARRIARRMAADGCGQLYGSVRIVERTVITERSEVWGGRDIPGWSVDDWEDVEEVT